MIRIQRNSFLPQRPLLHIRPRQISAAKRNQRTSRGRLATLRKYVNAQGRFGQPPGKDNWVHKALAEYSPLRRLMRRHRDYTPYLIPEDFIVLPKRASFGETVGYCTEIFSRKVIVAKRLPSHRDAIFMPENHLLVRKGKNGERSPCFDGVIVSFDLRHQIVVTIQEAFEVKVSSNLHWARVGVYFRLMNQGFFIGPKQIEIRPDEIVFQGSPHKKEVPESAHCRVMLVRPDGSRTTAGNGNRLPTAIDKTTLERDVRWAFGFPTE